MPNCISSSKRKKEGTRDVNSNSNSSDRFTEYYTMFLDEVRKSKQFQPITDIQSFKTQVMVIL
jgi:hypothetical protein